MAVLDRTGVRFAVETALIVATAAGTGLAHLGAWTIVGAVVVVWLATSLFEYSRSHPRPARAPSGRVAESLDTVPEAEEPFERVRVLAGPTAASESEPRRETAPDAAADAELFSHDEPFEDTQSFEGTQLFEDTEVFDDSEPLEDAEPSDDEGSLGGTPSESESESEPEPQARQDVEYAPQPEREPEPMPVATAPWSWNVWNLERVVRERASTNEELGFLLLYLRDYASPSGMLPPDFDSLVRESFGDLLAAPV